MLFIDTGALLARYIERDQHHGEAKLAWAQLQKHAERCATSNFVLDEFLTLLARRTSYAFAAERARVVYLSRMLLVLRPTEEDELQAVGNFEKFADQQVSFTDCVSFALMRRSKLRRVFSYDRHFLQAGFQLWPAR
ncbi:MAG: PIN domain-containing protein [Planctomycetes bacterium]|nr:PIN domain-containing protein [Planctomycetota bacterium]